MLLNVINASRKAPSIGYPSILTGYLRFLRDDLIKRLVKNVRRLDPPLRFDAGDTGRPEGAGGAGGAEGAEGPGGPGGLTSGFIEFNGGDGGTGPCSFILGFTGLVTLGIFSRLELARSEENPIGVAGPDTGFTGKTEPVGFTLGTITVALPSPSNMSSESDFVDTENVTLALTKAAALG